MAGQEDTGEMDWSALIGGLIGAGIPAVLACLGLHRARQSADAEAFGPAVLRLDRVNPERVTINFSPDATAENAQWAELRRQLDMARERLLVVSAGNPRRHVRELAQAAEVKVDNAFKASHWAVRDVQEKRDNREALDHARKTHAEASTAMRNLIEANFGWRVLRRGRRWPSRSRRSPRRGARPAGKGILHHSLSLLAQWGGTLVHGSGTRLPVVSLIGAQGAHTALSTVSASREPPGPAGLIQDVTSVGD
ncbi:MAG TPA: hypothetical protein VGJ54_04715 [Streptosporangiaceae bacterium]